ncbi:MAG: 3-hydroxy-9,10-secoandrosta-1,3,5(10)-triene-9,17-dione monooxygenase reductase component [Gammaproteobacteria bacterium]|jgi:3-hydroxy-9,10-secoandrosta-1,3,5(10)-triene-9,17-dione monooxygenase reductase component
MIDQTLYKSVLGNFVTGVVVVTTIDEDNGIAGLTANAFSAVSLEPPLIMVCTQKKSSSYQRILTQETFAVHILADHQVETAWAFARQQGSSMADVKWHINEKGIPVLDEYMSLIECRLWKAYDGGDHNILVGEVLSMDTKEDNDTPLIFHRGSMAVLPSTVSA